MNTTIRIFLLLLLTATAAYIFLPNDEKAIRNNLDSLAEYCSSPENETAIPALKKIALAGRLFNYPCTIHIESQDIDRTFNKKELSDHILMLKTTTLNTHFSFHDTAINFPLDTQAEIITTLRLDGKTKDSRYIDAYEIRIEAIKSDGDWLFSNITVVDFVEK